MDIKTLWFQGRESYPGERGPEMVAAWDEYSMDENPGGYEAERAKLIAEWGDELESWRELIIIVPYASVTKLFEVPSVRARPVE